MSLDSFIEPGENRKARLRTHRSPMEERSQRNSQMPEILFPAEKWSPQWFQELSKDELCELLRQAVEKSPLFANQVAWTRETLLVQTPQPKPQDIASLLGITLGEACIILDEIFKEPDP